MGKIGVEGGYTNPQPLATRERQYPHHACCKYLPPNLLGAVSGELPPNFREEENVYGLGGITTKAKPLLSLHVIFGLSIRREG